MRYPSANKYDNLEDFFREAFTDPTTNKPYKIPDNLKQAAIDICRSYSISGICDPMYIANIIAERLDLGDGFSNFK